MASGEGPSAVKSTRLVSMVSSVTARKSSGRSGLKELCLRGVQAEPDALYSLIGGGGLVAGSQAGGCEGVQLRAAGASGVPVGDEPPTVGFGNSRPQWTPRSPGNVPRRAPRRPP